MTLRERFEELGVPTLSDMPEDMAQVVQRGLDQGRILMITRVQPEPGIWQAEWAFLRERRNDDY